MLTLIARSLARLLPQDDDMPAPVSRADDEQWQRAAGWHASSWELSNGLDVIEMTLAQQEHALTHGFSDTIPACRREPGQPLLAA